MLKIVKAFATVSRVEFLLPNLVSLTMGLAWAVVPSISSLDLLIGIAVSLVMINLSSLMGAQVNTLSDYELDVKDERKRNLVEATEYFGRNRLKIVVLIEFVAALATITAFVWVRGKPILLLLWLLGISFGSAYSSPPLRLKSRSWMALVSLVLALSILPVVFVFYVFSSGLDPLFLLSVIGLTLTIYGLIVPTEIRDYFGDQKMTIETVTVHLGLVKSSVFSIVLLLAGGVVTVAAFLLGFVVNSHPILGVCLIAVAVADFLVLRGYLKLYRMIKDYAASELKGVAESIMDLSSHNPRWIMLVTQTYSVISLVLLLSKFLL